MKFYLISDNTDTLVGMRLAGIEGEVAHTENEVLASFKKACANRETAVVLITAKCMALCKEEIYRQKLRGFPLIVEVADRHGEGNVAQSITQYVQDAVGIKI